MYKLSSFKIDVPPSKIAKYPPKNREDAKLMVVHKSTGKIQHLKFSNITKFLKPGDSLVLNDSKVLSGRIYGKKEKTEAPIEADLLRELDPVLHLWDASINPARKIRVGNKLYFICAVSGYVLVAEVIDNTTSRGRTIKFFFEGTSADLHAILYKMGFPSIPTSFDRRPNAKDKHEYQTVYAKDEKSGSTIPPDGGRSFTPYILKLLELQDVQMPTITLHTSINALDPITIQDLTRYTSIAAYYEVTQNNADIINATLAQKKKVFAVGISSLIALESAKIDESHIKATQNWTNLFISPNYESKIVSGLLTDFHSADTSYFVRTALFGGKDLIIHAYDVAKKENYQFSVYGDKMLILR